MPFLELYERVQFEIRLKSHWSNVQVEAEKIREQFHKLATCLNKCGMSVSNVKGVKP